MQTMREFELSQPNKMTNNQPTKNQSLKTSTLVELTQTTIDLFSKAKQKIQIYSHDLDPRILNHKKIEDIFLKFIRRSRFSAVEILITDEKYLQGVNHRLINLYQKYTSSIGIKIIPKDFHENHFAFYLIDQRSLIYRRIADRYESELYVPPSAELKRKSKYFDEVWQQSQPAIYLRSLNL